LREPAPNCATWKAAAAAATRAVDDAARPNVDWRTVFELFPAVADA
jgi:hypothetical protein